MYPLFQASLDKVGNLKHIKIRQPFSVLLIWIKKEYFRSHFPLCLNQTAQTLVPLLNMFSTDSVQNFVLSAHMSLILALTGCVPLVEFKLMLQHK